jgi:hypothetical protein
LAVIHVRNDREQLRRNRCFIHNQVVDLWPLVLTDGCRAAASGRIVFADGEFWFEPPLPVPLVYYEPGSEPAPRPSGWGVRLSEVDLAPLPTPA